MSHEGIRILSQEQARLAAAQEARLDKPLQPEATLPAKVKVARTEGTGVVIEWKDGHRSAWSFTWLRHACPCATCQEERQHAHRAPGVPPPAAPGLFPLYQAPPRPLAVNPVGKYALQFQWNDGHQAGIYSWEYLRRVCQCEACIQRAQDAQ